MKNKLGLLAVLGFAMCAFAGPYDAWSSYRKVTVNTTTAAVAGTVTNFPLLVRLTNADAAHGSDVLAAALAAGADIRFSDSTGTTALAYQIERWTASAADIWVLVPSIPGSSSTSIRMYWGNGSATSASSGAAVFDTANGFVGVWHLGDAAGIVARPSAVPGAPSAQLRNFPTSGYVAPAGVIGLADTLRSALAAGGATFPGDDYLDIGHDSAFGNTNYPGFMNFTTGFSYSIWYYDAGPFATERLLNFGSDSAGMGATTTTNRIVLMGDKNASATTPNLSVRYGVGTTAYTAYDGTATYTINSWHHVFMTKAPGTNGISVYLDGVSYGTTSTAYPDPAVVARNYFWIGRSSATDRFWKGKLDEPEMSRVARSADWIKLSYQTQQTAQTAVTLGTTQSTASVPGAPTVVTGTAGNGQVAVSWTAPSSNGGAAITAYTATSTPGSLTCSTTGGTSCTVTGLTNGTGYTFTVTATNSAGTGPASSPSASVTPVAPVGVPTAPLTVTGTAGNAQVAVSWATPSSNGGSTITGYTVTSNPDGKTCTTTGALTCTVATLTNGTPYTFTVTAANTAGTSVASAPSTAVTPVGAPAAPTNASGTSGNAQVAVSWSAPSSNGGSAIILYTATASPGSATCTSTGALTCNVTGLTNGTAYTFTVTATNTAGTGAASTASASVTPMGPPGAPFNVTAVPGDAQAAVSWLAPSSNGGSAIILYTATATPGGATCTSTSALTCTITGLAANSYTFAVTATNAVGGAGVASAPSASVTAVESFSARSGFGVRRTGSSVSFRLPATTSGVQISVMDIWGRTVWSQDVGAGVGELVWNGKSAQGQTAPHGVYLVRLKAGSVGSSRVLAESKVMLLP